MTRTTDLVRLAGTSSPDGSEREVCSDCGRMSRAVCPWRAATCSDCSVARDASRIDCPAHGAYLPEAD